MDRGRAVFDALVAHAVHTMTAFRKGRMVEVERTQGRGSGEVHDHLHGCERTTVVCDHTVVVTYEPLAARCIKCRYTAYEHDPVDMRCPEDEDEALANREEGELDCLCNRYPLVGDECEFAERPPSDF